ncbi:MAG: hypothetical protein HY675_07500 [Chloroflexi bacterium]|nr:hypothetical protein [Chloroflexota bacterium]
MASLCLVLLALVLWLIYGPIGKPEPVAAVLSPNGRFVAVVSLYNYGNGAGSDYSTKVDLRDLRAMGGRGGAPSHLLLGARNWIKVVPTWEGNNTLVIEYEDRDVYSLSSGEPWRGVNFIFRKTN